MKSAITVIVNCLNGKVGRWTVTRGTGLWEGLIGPFDHNAQPFSRETALQLGYKGQDTLLYTDTVYLSSFIAHMHTLSHTWLHTQGEKKKQKIKTSCILSNMCRGEKTKTGKERNKKIWLLLHHATKLSISPLYSPLSSSLMHPTMEESSENFWRWQKPEPKWKSEVKRVKRNCARTVPWGTPA